ncbi:MAG TPA: nodulation protein NfeD [Lacunisphaera sp.]|nr:nodulation protein NfeD [Lacunisphaera sp.]
MKSFQAAAFFATLAVTGLAAGTPDRVARMRIDGPIGPATADYVVRAVDRAETEGVQCLIIELDTPGGLLDSTKTIVQKLLASPVPTVVHVTPAGATAASAGCFITLAADVAAMAPTTTIGAAHPVALGGDPGGDSKPDETLRAKFENYAASYIEAIAARRHRNVEWARSAVKDSASIPAAQAREIQVVDLIAANLPELLDRLDGREVNGRVLRTHGATVMEIPMTAREKAFQAFWRPEIMFLLMLVALYGIVGELSNPGAVLPGVAGLIALIVALYMAAILPVNTAGAALIVLAVLLFVVDVYAPTHGVLTGGGIIAFFLGALMLFDRTDPAFRLSLGLILPATALTALFFIVIVGAGLRAQRLPVRAGREILLGQVMPAEARIDASGGWVRIEGERWRATCETVVDKDQPVEVIGIEGLTLKVKPATP